jgi:phosphohistidine phosphatase SixA
LNWLDRGGAEQVMIVGHAPDVGCLAAELLTKGDLNLVFKKAAACCISFSGPAAVGEGRLEWLIQPKALRLMAVR